jgi:hypothetical protein
MKNKIKESYVLFVLNHGREPESIYKFAKDLELTEAEFYENFNSFKQINAEIWKGYFENTMANIKAEEVFDSYSVREKLLSFFYTLIEEMKGNRSFILKGYDTLEKPLNMKKNAELADAKRVFVDFINELVIEGQETREVESRPIPQITAKYPEWIWMLALSIIDFWIKDDSKLFEKTDTLIEKSVNTTMDWMARTPLDSLFDLGKFLFQNRS